MTDIDAVAAELSIRRVVDTLFAMTDTKDWATVGGLFTDDIDVDMSSLGGPSGPSTAAALVDGWQQGLHQDKQSHHMASNIRVDVAGDTATVTCQGYAYNLLTGAAADDVDDPMWEVWGTYTFPATRTVAGWRLAGFAFHARYSRGNAAVPAHTRS